MVKLKRFYNQNRKRIWMIVGIIAFLLIILQVLNGFAKRNSEQEVQNARTQLEQQTRSSSNSESIARQNSNSNTSRKKSQKETINEFINYCNSKELENAYNMLTDECKGQMFSDLETFERIYYSSAFENKSKEAKIENWDSSTYLVFLKQSALSSGKLNDDNQKGDYITVTTDKEGNQKLNINSYIGYKEIKKIKEEDKIQIQVEGKNTYVDYEEYTINIKNNSNSDIQLDSLYDSNSIYIEDINNVKYPAHTNEVSSEILTIPSGHTKQLKIKFYSSYSSSKKINSLVFSDFWKDNKTKTKFKIEL